MTRSKQEQDIFEREYLQRLEEEIQHVDDQDDYVNWLGYASWAEEQDVMDELGIHTDHEAS